MKTTNMPMRTKLICAFGSLVLMVTLVSWLSLQALGDANARFTEFVDGVNQRAQTAMAIRAAVDRRAVAARNLVLYTRPERLESEQRDVRQAQLDVKTQLDKLKQLSTAPGVSEHDRSLIAAIESVESSYGPVAANIVRLAIEGQRDEATARIERDCGPLLVRLKAATGNYEIYASEVSSNEAADARTLYATNRAWLIGACAAALLTAWASGFWIVLGLMRALGAEPGDLGAVAQRVANGHLGPIAGADAAPANSVLSSLGQMQASLAKVVNDVRRNAESVATASSEISQGTLDLSQRTEEQASALQQTAASMHQLSSSVAQNANHAKVANALAVGATQVAQRGGAVMADVVETMKGITASSGQISDIVGVIDGIAFQTNILALNAAVEAARAGEQGRGFAVVASEVRGLAQRSADAAKEVRRLILDSAERVQHGAGLVGQAGTTMDEIVDSIRRVAGIMGDITRASVEQSGGVSQMGDAINQMDQVTQQNAALVEQSAAASESLKSQASLLVSAVAVFRLGD